MATDTGTMIDFKAGDDTARGYLVSPEGQGAPGLIVLQEWWGLVPHIKDLAQRFADQGYAALAPDLYHGASTVEAEEAEHLMNGLDWSQAATEIKAAAAELRRRGHEKVGVVGFCMGGALACIAAATAEVDAAVAFYGFPPDKQVMTPTCPPTKIYFGSDEGFFDVKEAQFWAERQRSAGVEDTEVVIYEGAGHAFFNDTRPEAYHEASAKDAWTRTLDHFAAHLKG